MFWEIVRKLVMAALLVGAGTIVASWLAGVIRGDLERSRLDPVVRRLVVLAVRPVVLVVAVVAALQWMGIDAAGVLVVLAAGGIAVALGLRDTIAHAAAGAVLLTLRPFDPKDEVEIAGELGAVVELSLLATRLRTHDGAEITVPNGLVLARPIRNLTRAAPASPPAKERKAKAPRAEPE